jgi:hypothetical protein
VARIVPESRDFVKVREPALPPGKIIFLAGGAVEFDNGNECKIVTGA